MESYIWDLLYRCDEARHGKLPKEDLDALAEECKGLRYIPIFGRNIFDCATERNWSALRGALAPLLNADAGGNVNVTQSATATASVDISQSVSVIQSLPESSLSDEDKTTLIGLLATLQSLDGEQKKSKLMEVLRFLCDKAADAAIAVIPIVAGMV